MDHGKDKRARVREFKITKGILEKFVYCKGCDATVFGAGARMHSDDCRRRFEEAIKNDDILKVRLDMRDIRFNRMKNEEAEERNDANVKAEKVDVEMQTDEAEVASELLREKTNNMNGSRPFSIARIIEATGGRSNHGTKRDENHTTEDEREQDNKRRRMQVLSSENVILRTLKRTVGAGSQRLKVNVTLRQLEFDNDTSEHCMDISNLIGAVDYEMSPHEEVEEMERWRRMFEGYEFVTICTTSRR